MTKAAAIHLLTEFSPVLAFFIVGQFYSFYIATAVLLTFTVVALAIGWIYEKRIALMPIIASLFVIIPGYMTLQFQSPGILIFGDSLFYFLMAAAVGGGLLVNRLFLKAIFEATFAMADEGWRILSLRWTVAFLLAGIGNEIVRIYLTPEIWVDYKFVKVIIVALFGIWQFRLSRRYRIPGVSNEWGLRLKRFSHVHYSANVTETLEPNKTD